MNAANWNSLHDQTGSAWFESNQGNNRLTEFRTAGDIAINGGSTLPLGNVYAPANPAFGTPIEDLTFEYEKADGSVITGFVNYINGAKKYNNLVLEINSAGHAQILNDSQQSVNIEGYTIGSSDGSLLTGTWNSLDDQNAAGGDWLEANPLASRISEFKSGGSTTLNNLNGVNLGQIFNSAGSQDGITFEFLIAGQSTPFTGAVTFRDLSTITPIGPAGVLGDYNNDHVVDAADYVVWRKNLGQNVVLPNDSTSGTVGAEDYGVWRSHFGMTSGSGAGNLGSVAVPEPNVSCLMVLGLSAAICNRRRIGRYGR
jgi:hypothetical protein